MSLLLGACGGTSTPSGPGPGPSPSPTTAPAKLELIEIAESETHACGITADGRAFCWGSNDDGQLGTGTTIAQTTAAPAEVVRDALEAGTSFEAIVTGVSFTCGLAGAKAYCWGKNDLGQSGSTDAGSNKPAAIAGNEHFQSLAAGYGHACGVSDQNEIWCWGRNEAGQLGRGAVSPFERAPQKIDVALLETGGVSGVATFVQVTAGEVHTCGLTSDGRPFCWGSDAAGQLGVSAGDDSIARPKDPVDSTGLDRGDTFVELAAGGRHTCGLTEAGAAYCWGDNASGQLGIDSVEPSAQQPNRIRIGDAKFFAQLTAGGAHTCGLTTASVAFCWGSNSGGQLGNGTKVGSTRTPGEVLKSKMVAGDVFVRLVAAVGGDYGCGLTAKGHTFCWGSAPGLTRLEPTPVFLKP